MLHSNDNRIFIRAFLDYEGDIEQTAQLLMISEEDAQKGVEDALEAIRPHLEYIVPLSRRGDKDKSSSPITNEDVSARTEFPGSEKGLFAEESSKVFVLQDVMLGLDERITFRKQNIQEIEREGASETYAFFQDSFIGILTFAHGKMRMNGFKGCDCLVLKAFATDQEKEIIISMHIHSRGEKKIAIKVGALYITMI